MILLPDLVDILETAKAYLLEVLCVPDFDLIGINWMDDECQWCVSFISEYSNHEYISVFVVGENGNYRPKGYSFEEPDFQI